MRKLMIVRYRLARLVLAAVLVFASAAAAALAGQSLVLAESGNQSFSLPGQAKTASWRIEFQLHGVGVPLSDTNIFGMAGFVTRLYSGGKQFYIAPQQDSYPGGTPCIFSTVGRSNMLVRIQRDYSAMKYYCEIWEADGTNYRFQALTILSANSDAGPDGYIDGRYATAKLGFLRMASTLVPIKSRPPVTADTGDLLELRFDGDGKDSSGKKRNMSASGFSFAPTPGQNAFALPTTPGTPEWAPSLPLRAGYPSALASNSYSMADGSATVDCSWTQLEGPSSAIFDNRASCSPTLTGLVFGPYTFRLTVTDSAGQQASADFDVGAVAYDDNGVVIYPDERLYSLLGPSKVMGQNPWEWADSQSVKMAVKNWDNYKINGGTWDAEWLLSTVNGVPRSGTVYTQTGVGNKLYGVGTNFKQVFCGGSTGAVVKPMYISVNLPTADPGDEPLRYPRYVASCESDTELTFVSGWIWERPQIASPGVSWGTSGECADCALWMGRNFTSDVNFYDNALAHYALYYRTGWKKARDAARWMADRYAYSPWISGVMWVPRQASLTSAYLRAAIDTGGPATKNVWPALRQMVDGNCSGETTSANLIGDVRESSYCLAFTALKATYDPDSTARTASLDRLVTGYTNRWGAQQRPAGNYVNNGFEGDMGRVHTVSQGSATVTRYSGPSYPSDYCGTVMTEAGSIAVSAVDQVSVTGTGTDFTGSAGKIIFLTGTLDGEPWSMVSSIAGSPVPTATTMKLNYPWRGDASSVTKFKIMSALPAGRAYWEMFMAPVNTSNQIIATMDEDSWYYCTVVDGNTLTLDKPYTRDTSGGNVYRRMTWQNLTGRGSQPFMMGITAWAEYLAADALDGYNSTVATNYRTVAGKTVDWIWSTGRNTATKGLRYGVEFSNCAALGFPSAFDCWSSDSNNERAYNIETIGAFSRRYLDTRDPDDKTVGDALYTDTYAKPGYASPFPGDGNYNIATDEGGYGFNFWLQTKNYGQAWGLGGGQTWPAARLGGVASPMPRDVQTGFQLSSVPGAVSVRIRTISPSGQTAVTDCGDSSPCHLSLDKRFGSYWMKLEYLSNSGEVIAASEPQLIRTP